MCRRRIMNPRGDAQYHHYHIQEQLARIRPSLLLEHCSDERDLSSTPSFPQSRLQSLPTELLAQIFSWLLHFPEGVWIRCFTVPGSDPGSHSALLAFESPTTPNELSLSTSLFLTSRRISNVALDVFYSSNEFCINFDQESFFRPWLLSIGTENRNRLTRLRFYGVVRTNELGIKKIGDSLQALRKLRRIRYQSENEKNPPASARTASIDVPGCHVSQYNNAIMAMYSKKCVPGRLRITGDRPYSLITMDEQPPKESRLLSLPSPIIRQILRLCYTDDRIALSSPLNLYPLDQQDTVTPSGYFSTLLVCKSLSRIMREIIYSSTTFSLQHPAFVLFSDVLRAEDFDRVTKLELLIGRLGGARLVHSIQCFKAILHRLLRPSSNIKKVEIKVQRLSVPYISILRDLLMELKKKCEVELKEAEDIKIELLGVQFNDLGWMLDDNLDPNTTWAWGHYSKKWKNLLAAEGDVVKQRRLDKTARVAIYTLTGVLSPVLIPFCFAVVAFELVRIEIHHWKRRRRARG
ncbi:hypothetical protein TWF481_004108 [Arthrobotrys musiformis]